MKNKEGRMNKLPKIREGKCPVCGIDIIANTPFIDGKICGYKSDDHGCGEENTLITFQSPDLVPILLGLEIGREEDE